MLLSLFNLILRPCGKTENCRSLAQLMQRMCPDLEVLLQETLLARQEQRWNSIKSKRWKIGKERQLFPHIEQLGNLNKERQLFIVLPEFAYL